MGHCRKHPFLPHSSLPARETTPTEENESFLPLPGCPNTLHIIRNESFSPSPPDGRNVFGGGAWIFFGMTQYWSNMLALFEHGFEQVLSNYKIIWFLYKWLLNYCSISILTNYTS